MSKREIAQIGSAGEDEGARKRRKETDGGPSVNSSSEGGRLGTITLPRPDPVKEQGMALWNIVKEATDKEGRVLSSEFLRRPNKRYYSDYYQIISAPISLEDIKKSIEGGTYMSLETMKAAFELCFNNAMVYNQDTSQIYLDAKQLKKIFLKAYNKVVAPGKDTSAGDSKDSRDSKAPNLTRLIKTRLQKLVELADEDGRIISQLFQELPDRKHWEIYYEHIKHPMSFEMISKKIKRKEYENVQQFADDVELLCSNALIFNQPGTPIYNDAKTLQTKFHELMSDMPEPFSLSKYSKPTKLTLKVPAVAHIAAKHQQPPPAGPSPPAPSKVDSPPVPEKPSKPVAAPPRQIAQPPAPAVPATPAASSKPAASAAIHSPSPMNVNTSGVLMLGPSAASATVSGLPKMTNTAVRTTQTRAQSAASRNSPRPAQATPQPLPPQSQPQSTYTNLPYQSTYNYRATPPVTSITPPVPANATVTKLSASKLGLALPKPKQPLRVASLKAEPSGRIIQLNHDEGVQTWMMRLGPKEKSLSLYDVAFLEEEEEENEDAMDVDGPKPAKRPRGRPPKSAAAKAAAEARAANLPPKPSSKMKEKIETQVKLNSVIMPEKEEDIGIWYLELAVGSNVVELGSKDGSLWKVYVDRTDEW